MLEQYLLNIGNNQTIPGIFSRFCSQVCILPNICKRVVSSQADNCNLWLDLPDNLEIDAETPQMFLLEAHIVVKCSLVKEFEGNNSFH